VGQLDAYEHLIKPELLIGTGGNLRALTRLAARFYHHPLRARLDLHELEHLTQILFRLSFGQRRKLLNLKPNRADVIRPATAIVLEFMHAFNFSRLVVPDVGLKNGVFWQLADRVAVKKVPTARRVAETRPSTN
jgi:exopolyphosphatase/guanosine-5'-triphosphate,3'-diphosphate pyrophosphatase